jgi:hypothetical protein
MNKNLKKLLPDHCDDRRIVSGGAYCNHKLGSGFCDDRRCPLIPSIVDNTSEAHVKRCDNDRYKITGQQLHEISNMINNFTSGECRDRFYEIYKEIAKHRLDGNE